MSKLYRFAALAVASIIATVSFNSCEWVGEGGNDEFNRAELQVNLSVNADMAKIANIEINITDFEGKMLPLKVEGQITDQPLNFSCSKLPAHFQLQVRATPKDIDDVVKNPSISIAYFAVAVDGDNEAMDSKNNTFQVSTRDVTSENVATVIEQLNAMSFSIDITAPDPTHATISEKK